MEKRKVCVPAPHKLSVGRDVLEQSGCELAGEQLAASSILTLLEGKIRKTVVNPDAIEAWTRRFG